MSFDDFEPAEEQEPPEYPVHIVHSYSALSTFRTCPYRYEQTKLLKNYRDESGAEADFGTEQHDLAEMALKNDTPLSAEMGIALDFVRGFTGLKVAEQEVGVDIALKPCGFWDEDCWYRGKIDVTILNGDKAIIVDYKTGKRRLPFGVKGATKPDGSQMQDYSLLTFLHYPHITDIDAYLFFTHKANGKRPDRYSFNRAKDGVRMLQDMRRTPRHIDNRIDDGTFEKKPGGLCKDWCPVTGCNFHGKRQHKSWGRS